MTHGIRAVTSSACRNIGIGNSVLKDFFPRGYEFLWSTPEGFGIESPKIRGKSRYHRRTEGMRHVQHDIIRPPALNKGLQLIL